MTQRRIRLSEMPQDPFVPPATLAVMKGLREFHVASMMSGFPERIATDIVVGVIMRLLTASAEQENMVE
jgi:hypothetical protein